MWDSLPDPEWHENHCRINSSPISTMCQKSTPQHFVCGRIDAIPESWAPFSSQGGVQTLITHAPLDKTVKNCSHSSLKTISSSLEGGPGMLGGHENKPLLLCSNTIGPLRRNRSESGFGGSSIRSPSHKCKNPGDHLSAT